MGCGASNSSQPSDTAKPSNNNGNPSSNNTSPPTNLNSSLNSVPTSSGSSQSSPVVSSQGTTNQRQEPSPAPKLPILRDDFSQFSPQKVPITQLESNDPKYFPAYVGALERREAETILLTANPGVFLVRWSDNRKFYALTYVSPARRILHMGEINFDLNTPQVRILRENGPQFFPTFQELLKTLISEKLFDTAFEAVNYGELPAMPGGDTQQKVYEELDW